MPFVLDNNKSIRFQKGLKVGLEKATEKENIFVKNLLLRTSHSIEEIANLADVSVSFVEKVKARL